MRLSKDEIRIMDLRPGNFDDEINIELKTASLSSKPLLYDALSYVWGIEKCHTPARINGKPFTITSNLDVALRYLHDSAIKRRLWVDAVCINQEDNTEKSHQMQRMGQILLQGLTSPRLAGPDHRWDDVDAACTRLPRT